jgi:hypothetical protein
MTPTFCSFLNPLSPHLSYLASYCSLNARNQVSRSYKAAGKISSEHFNLCVLTHRSERQQASRLLESPLAGIRPALPLGGLSCHSHQGQKGRAQDKQASNCISNDTELPAPSVKE